MDGSNGKSHIQWMMTRGTPMTQETSILLQKKAHNFIKFQRIPKIQSNKLDMSATPNLLLSISVSRSWPTYEPSILAQVINTRMAISENGETLHKYPSISISIHQISILQYPSIFIHIRHYPSISINNILHQYPSISNVHKRNDDKH